MGPTHDPTSQPRGCKFSSFCIKFRTVFNCCPGEALQPLEHISASLPWARFLYLFKYLNIHWVEAYTWRASLWNSCFVSAAGRAEGVGALGPRLSPGARGCPSLSRSRSPAAAIGWALAPAQGSWAAKVLLHQQAERMGRGKGKHAEWSQKQAHAPVAW